MNRNRNVPKPMVHTPEWQRLGREPIANNFTPPAKNVTKKLEFNDRSIAEDDPRVHASYSADQIPDPPKKRPIKIINEEASSSNHEEVEESNESFSVNQYVIMYDGEVVSSSFDKEEIETNITEMLQQDADLNKIVLLHRLPIRVGVLVG